MQVGYTADVLGKRAASIFKVEVRRAGDRTGPRSLTSKTGASHFPKVPICYKRIAKKTSRQPQIRLNVTRCRSYFSYGYLTEKNCLRACALLQHAISAIPLKLGHTDRQATVPRADRHPVPRISLRQRL